MASQSPGTSWDPDRTRTWIAVPGRSDDKYSRGVLGVFTGSARYPGAAVLGVEAAWRTGVGMVRYLGPERAADAVLRRRPETVTAPGRVQAWLVGSGIARGDDVGEYSRAALDGGEPIVLDAGGIGLLSSLDAGRTVIITPHLGELVWALGSAGVETTVDAVSDDPSGWASRAAETLGVVVVLKGHRTRVAAPGGPLVVCGEATAWLATAGTGDVLGGVVGALAATHAGSLDDGGAEAAVGLAASASTLHALAAEHASGGGPITALDVAEALPATIASLLAGSAGARAGG